MFDSQQKPTGTQYTLTGTLATLGLVFIPLTFLVLGPFSILSSSLAVAGGSLCVGLAWMSWKKHSNLTIPSVITANSTRE
jgi:hypothetical protein